VSKIIIEKRRRWRELCNHLAKGIKMNEEIKELKSKVENLNVLYSEDEEEMRVGTELFLNKFFTSVDSSCDGLEGLEKFKEKKYDIVFSDVMMPRMDGLEMLKKIKEMDSNVFTVTLTASSVREKDIISTSDLYYRKPISYENMIEIMQKIVEKLNL